MPKSPKSPAPMETETPEKGGFSKRDLALACPIAHPLAGKKLTKKLLKMIKKAAKDEKSHVKRGVKEVVKALRKGEKGLCVIAADISPIDVISHLPVLCEDASVPYCYIPSKEELGTAGETKRPTSCLFLSSKTKKGEQGELYSEISSEISEMATV